MAHTKSSKKDIKRIKTRTVRNKALRSEMRTFTRKARNAVDAGGDDAVERVNVALIALDKMESKGIIKKNNASRRKSRLMHRLNVALGVVEPTVLRDKVRKPVARKTRIADEVSTEAVDQEVITESIELEGEEKIDAPIVEEKAKTPDIEEIPEVQAEDKSSDNITEDTEKSE